MTNNAKRGWGLQLAELGAVLLYGATGYIWPRFSVWLFPIALLPFAWRVISGKARLQRFVLDVPMLMFVLSAGVGVWASYNQPGAWQKYGLLLGSVLLYYALANLSLENLRFAARVFAGFSVLVALYFLLSNDWLAQPADVDLLNRIGQVWMQIRPFALPSSVHPNFAGGWMAVFLPFLLYEAWQMRRRSWRHILSAVVGICTAAFGLLMTSSRAAWLALTFALLFWGAMFVSGKAGSLLNPIRVLIFRIGLFGSLITLVLIFIISIGGPVEFARLLPGPNSSVSRLEIDSNTVRLVADYPLTGAGLRSFPGQYSHYMLVIPYFIFDYAHNMYLDIALEQGLPGIFASLWIFIGAAWLLISASIENGAPGSKLRRATITALIVFLAHGIVDSPFYGIRGTPLLFVLPGMASALSSHARVTSLKKSRIKTRRPANRRLQLVVAILSGLSILLLTIVVLPDLWFSNVAAVSQAKVDLQGFPTGEWRIETEPFRYETLQRYYEQALNSHPRNITALHRLGLLALARQEYPLACEFLDSALAVDPGHRGIIKNLGYCLVWMDEFTRAAELLKAIPEATGEMQAYATFWQVQGQPQLAVRAAKMAQVLASE